MCRLRAAPASWIRWLLGQGYSQVSYWQWSAEPERHFKWIMHRKSESPGSHLEPDSHELGTGSSKWNDVSLNKSGHQLPFSFPWWSIIRSFNIHNPVPLDRGSFIMLMNGQLDGTTNRYTGGLLPEFEFNQSICCEPNPRLPKYPDCAEVHLRRDDPYYGKYGFDCINFIRSQECSTCDAIPRRQINMRTSFIDASTVYADAVNNTNHLREFKGGRLKMSSDNLLIDVGKEEIADCGMRFRDNYPNEDVSAIRLNCPLNPFSHLKGLTEITFLFLPDWLTSQQNASDDDDNNVENDDDDCIDKRTFRVSVPETRMQITIRGK